MSTDTFRRYLDLLNEAETANPLQDLIKPRTDGGNYIDPKTGFIMYVPRKNPRAGLDAPDPDPKPLTLGLLKQPEAQEIKNALKAAGLEIISAEKPSLFGSYPVAAVDPEQLARALAGSSRQNSEIAAGPAASSIVKDAPAAVAAAAEKTNDAASTTSADSAVSSVAVAGGEEDNSKLGGETHCARCGTPKMMHKDLNHDFVQGNDVPPQPVPQSGETGDSERSDRIKKMQEELKKAGADLGTFGPDGNGIDGVIGKFTRAAMAKYPDIAKKYPELGTGGETNKETTGGKLDKVNTALTTIEQILSKYKTKLKEDAGPLTLAEQMKNWRALMELTQADMDAAAAKRRAAQGANQSAIDARFAADAKAKKIGPYYSDTPAQAMPYSQAAQEPWKGPAAGSAAGSAAGEASGLSKLWKGAKGLAAKVALPLAALYSIWDGYKQISALDTSMPQDQYRAAVSKIVARLVNEFGLFWVGAILGAAIAGAVTGPGALIGFVAGGAGGIAANYFLGDSVNAITDEIVDSLYGTGGPSMSAEDRAAITQNLAIIEDFVKNNPSEITPELRDRIDTVTKAAKAALAQSSSQKPAAPAAPAAPPATAEPAPAGGGDNGIPSTADINTTLDKMDKFLTKHQFENARRELLKNQHLLSETERMALHRDLLKDDWSDYAIGAGAGAAAGAVAGRAAGRSAAAAPVAVPPEVTSRLAKAASAIKATGKWAAILAVGAASVWLWNFIKNDPQAAAAAGLTPQEMEEWNQLNTQMNQLIPTEEVYNALPYDVQKKAVEINGRRQKFNLWVKKKLDQQASQPPK